MSEYKLLTTHPRETIQRPITLDGHFEYGDCDESSSDEGAAQDWERNKHARTKWFTEEAKHWTVENDRKRRSSFERTQLLDQNGGTTVPYTSTHSPATEEELPFPSKIFYIVGSEFCERFCYYGLRTILVLYFSKELLMTERSATSMFHAWTFLCYFTPIFGAIIADSFLGRYKTILSLSILYLIGNIVLSFSAIKPLIPDLSGKKTFAVIGLVTIAFGTGGIKPCVSAFGGDQFQLPQQEKMLTKFFSIFYFSINAGSLLSTIITPILREDVSCFGGECFPLAFGVPAVLMLIAVVVFVSGSPQYNTVPPEGNIACDVVKCILYAGYRKIKNSLRRCMSALKFIPTDIERKEMQSSHWLHLAADRYPWSLIKDVKILVRVLVLYLPLPFFWALYDQQGSRWTFQASKMSGTFGSWTIKPDQMQVLNPILLLLMIPFFDSVVYPFLTRFGVLKNPLQRMLVGSLSICLAFVASGILQIAIENSRGDHGPKDGGRNFVVVNILPCPVRFGATSSGLSSTSIPAYDSVIISYTKEELKWIQNNSPETGPSLQMQLIPYGQSSQCKLLSWEIAVAVKNILLLPEQKEIFVAITSYLGKLAIVPLPNSKSESEAEDDKNGASKMRIIDSTDIMRFLPVYLRGKEESVMVKSEFFAKGISYAEVSVPHELKQFDIVLPSVSNGTTDTNSLGSVSSPLSSSSILLMYSPSTDPKERVFKVFSVSKPSIHMFWLFPQYLLLSAGEVMFSITGLEFSFTRAPSSMKSVVQAAWLLTNAFGDLLVVIVAEGVRLEKQSMEFFLFAGLMFVDMFIFYALGRRFTYNEKKNKEHQMLHFSSDESDTG